MLKLSDKEVNESLKKIEEKLTLRFNTCLILMKDIEHVVKNANNTWKNIYILHKQRDFIVNVSDKDEDDDGHEKDEEVDNEEVTHYDSIDDKEEEQGQEATKEDLPTIQNTKETNLEKIYVVVIASHPHSPSETLKILRLEKATSKLIMKNIISTRTQSIFAPI